MDFDYKTGIFTVFKKENQICLCLQTEIFGNPKIL
jgi:hypothetical protein